MTDVSNISEHKLPRNSFNSDDSAKVIEIVCAKFYPQFLRVFRFMNNYRIIYLKQTHAISLLLQEKIIEKHCRDSQDSRASKGLQLK